MTCSRPVRKVNNRFEQEFNSTTTEIVKLSNMELIKQEV